MSADFRILAGSGGWSVAGAGEAQGEAVALGERLPFNGIGEFAHQRNALTAGHDLFQRDGGRRGQRSAGIEGTEMRRSVFNDERHAALRSHAEFDFELLGRIAGVAVADDVGERFLQAELDGEAGALREVVAGGQRLHPAQRPARGQPTGCAASGGHERFAGARRWLLLHDRGHEASY